MPQPTTVTFFFADSGAGIISGKSLFTSAEYGTGLMMCCVALCCVHDARQRVRRHYNNKGRGLERNYDNLSVVCQATCTNPHNIRAVQGYIHNSRFTYFLVFWARNALTNSAMIIVIWLELGLFLFVCVRCFVVC